MLVCLSAILGFTQLTKLLPPSINTFTEIITDSDIQTTTPTLISRHPHILTVFPQTTPSNHTETQLITLSSLIVCLLLQLNYKPNYYL